MTHEVEELWTKRIKNLGFPIVVATIALYGAWSVGNRLIDEHIKFLSKVSAATEIQATSQIQMTATLASLESIQKEQVGIERQILESQKEMHGDVSRTSEEQANRTDLQRQMNDMQKQMIELLREQGERIRNFSSSRSE